MPDGMILSPGLRLGGGRRELLSLDPINRGLLGFWPMQESGGVTVDDISPYRTSGTAVNNPPSVLGPGFRARTFVNTGGSSTRRINLGAYRPWSTLQIPMTIAAWVKPTSTVNGTIFSQYSQFDFDGRFGKWLGITSGGQVQAIIGKSVWNYYQFFNGPTYTLNRWALLAWVLSGTAASPSLRIYYDATSTTHTPVAMGGVDSAVETWIGSSVLASTYPSNEGFAGDIGPVRLWGRAVPHAEVARLARDPWAGTATVADRLWVSVRVPSGNAWVESISESGAVGDAASAAQDAAAAVSAAGEGADAIAAALAGTGAAAMPGAASSAASAAQAGTAAVAQPGVALDSAAGAMAALGAIAAPAAPQAALAALLAGLGGITAPGAADSAQTAQAAGLGAIGEAGAAAGTAAIGLPATAPPLPVAAHSIAWTGKPRRVAWDGEARSVAWTGRPRSVAWRKD